MNMVKWRKNEMLDPLGEFDRLQNEINKLFDFSYPGSTGLFDRKISPPIDVVEDGDGVVVTCDLPGVDRKNLDISVAANSLTIKGEKKDEKEVKEGKVYRKESWSGSFQRTLSLPETVDPNKVEAVLKDGVLTIRLSKREEMKPKQISVNIK